MRHRFGPFIVAAILATGAPHVEAQQVYTGQYVITPTILARDGTVKSCGIRLVAASDSRLPDEIVYLVDSSIALSDDFMGIGKGGIFTTLRKNLGTATGMRQLGDRLLWIKVGSLPAMTPIGETHKSPDSEGYWFYATAVENLVDSYLALLEGARVRVAFQRGKRDGHLVVSGQSHVDSNARAEIESCIDELLANMKKRIEKR